MLNIGRKRDGQGKKDLGNKIAIDFNNMNFYFVGATKFRILVSLKAYEYLELKVILGIQMNSRKDIVMNNNELVQSNYG